MDVYTLGFVTMQELCLQCLQKAQVLMRQYLEIDNLILFTIKLFIIKLFIIK